MNGERSSGFTLLEVVISLTITAIIVVMLFGAMRIGVRAWEKGEKDLDVRLRDRVVLDLVKRQLSSLRVREQKEDEKSAFLNVKGESSSLRVVSHLPIMPANEFGAVFVRYGVSGDGDDKRLTVFERNLVFLDQEADPESEGSGEEETLVEGLSEISFGYLKDDDEGGGQWLEQWDPDEEKTLPSAFRITLRRGDESLTAIARVEGRPQTDKVEKTSKDERVVERSVRARGSAEGTRSGQRDKRTSIRSR